MGGFLSALAPHVRPLERSVGAPWSPLIPARSSYPIRATESLATSDNLTQWDPYSGNDTNLEPWFSGDNPRPLPTRPAIGSPWVTPLGMWNLAGPGGWDADWPILRKAPGGVRYYQFGFQTPGQAPWGGLGHLEVKRPNPPVPPPMPFLGFGQ